MANLVEKKDVVSFALIEKEMDLFHRQYNGFYYWQYLRFPLCESIFCQKIDSTKRDKKQKRKDVSRIVGLIHDVLCDIRMLFFSKKIDMIVFRQTPMKDVFFDSWVLPDTIKAYTYRVGIYPTEKVSIREHHLGLPRIATILSRIINCRKNTTDNKEVVFLQELENVLIDRFGQVMPVDEMITIIQKNAFVHQYYRHYYEKVFAKTDCKAILTIVYYQDILFPAYEVAKEKGILIIELQHGVINNHESYWFEDQTGANNYTPNVLLTFGEIHNQWVKLVSDCEAFAVGFPYQERMVQETKEIVPDDYSIVIYPEINTVFEDTIVDFLKLDAIKRYKVYLKLHPLQFGKAEKYFPKLSKIQTIEIIDSQEKSIYFWLKTAKHHVMASTTVGLEAMAFDHCNVCIAENIPHEQTQCLIDWGLARGFSTANELLNLVENPIPNSEEKYNIRDSLWKRGAKKNIEEFFSYAKKNDWKLY